jgi:hypothetical protein
MPDRLTYLTIICLIDCEHLTVVSHAFNSQCLATWSENADVSIMTVISNRITYCATVVLHTSRSPHNALCVGLFHQLSGTPTGDPVLTPPKPRSIPLTIGQTPESYTTTPPSPRHATSTPSASHPLLYGCKCSPTHCSFFLSPATGTHNEKHNRTNAHRYTQSH